MDQRTEANSGPTPWTPGNIGGGADALRSKDPRALSPSEICQRLGKVEGIGPVTATALVAAVGDPIWFKNGQDCSEDNQIQPNYLGKVVGKCIYNFILRKIAELDEFDCPL